MAEFYENGKKNEIQALYTNGVVGQIVILGQQVCWDHIDPNEEPLAQYPYCSIFTIVEKVEGKDGYYLLQDVNGNVIKLQDKYRHEASLGGYIYDAQEWLTFNHRRETAKISEKNQEIKKLEEHLELLKDILIKQGIRVVSAEQAGRLGIK